VGDITWADEILEKDSDTEDEESAEDDSDDDAEESISAEFVRSSILSYAVGVAFGRFDVRRAAAESQMLSAPRPFDPLPTQAPGMLSADAEPFHVHAGMLVDDQGDMHDLARLVEEVLVRLKMTVPDGVRRWLQRDFFAFHLQRYSKSRRKAPIYWPLSTTSGSYTLWVYYPTFPFEERTFLRIAIKGIVTGETDATRRVLTRQKSSVWLGKGESQAQWDLIRSGLSLVEACDDFERQLPDHARSQAELIDFYLGSLREADRLQREFEQAAGDFLDQHGLMHEVIDQARARYRRLAEKVQGVFVKHVESTGWPPGGRLANADAFDRLVADRLKESGRKVAYLMVDALRYELGVALEKLLAEDGPVELQAAYAQLPTITLVGMASLLPGARTGLTLAQENDSLVPKLAGVCVLHRGSASDPTDAL
jgi:hypothetical protein